jgi:hypothetical protein
MEKVIFINNLHGTGLCLLLGMNNYMYQGCLFEIFCHFLVLAFRRSKSWMIQKREAEKLMEMCFQLLTFCVIQILDLLKANKENDEELKTNIPLVNV